MQSAAETRPPLTLSRHAEKRLVGLYGEVPAGWARDAAKIDAGTAAGLSGRPVSSCRDTYLVSGDGRAMFVVDSKQQHVITVLRLGIEARRIVQRETESAADLRARLRAHVAEAFRFQGVWGLRPQAPGVSVCQAICEAFEAGRVRHGLFHVECTLADGRRAMLFEAPPRRVRIRVEDSRP